MGASRLLSLLLCNCFRGVGAKGLFQDPKGLVASSNLDGQVQVEGVKVWVPGRG